MPAVLLIGHDENETFGLAPIGLADRSLEVLEHRASSSAPLPALDEVSGVVVFGGEMNVNQTDLFPFLADERAYVRSAVDAGVPYLGICLGSQMLARAMGHKVYPAGVRELGFNALHPTPEAKHDPVLSVFREGDMVFHWHEDTFELPEGATVLGTGDVVHLQAFRIGDRAWGTQFHFEVDRAELELWLEAAGEDVVRAWGKTSAQVLEESDRFHANQQERAIELFGRFGDVVRSASTARSSIG
ncbi:MAG: type 1 glutamine amidotransferase [Actinomycetota bacterium]